MPEPIRPEDFTGSVNCGTVLAGDGVAQLSFHLPGDGGGYYTLTVDGQRGRSVTLYLGAAEWRQFRDAVSKGQRVFDSLRADGKCSELTPCPPG